MAPMDHIPILREQILANARYQLATGILPNYQPGMTADNFEIIFSHHKREGEDIQGCGDEECKSKECDSHDFCGLLLVSMDPTQGGVTVISTIISKADVDDNLVDAYYAMLHDMAVKPVTSITSNSVKPVGKEKSQVSSAAGSEDEASDWDLSGKPVVHEKKEVAKDLYYEEGYESSSDHSAKLVKKEVIDEEDSMIMDDFLIHQAAPMVHQKKEIVQTSSDEEDSEPDFVSKSSVQQKKRESDSQFVTKRTGFFAPEVKKGTGPKPAPKVADKDKKALQVVKKEEDVLQVIKKEKEADKPGKKQKGPRPSPSALQPVEQTKQAHQIMNNVKDELKVVKKEKEASTPGKGLKKEPMPAPSASQSVDKDKDASNTGKKQKKSKSKKRKAGQDGDSNAVDKSSNTAGPGNGNDPKRARKTVGF